MTDQTYKKALDAACKYCSKGEKSRADVIKKLEYYNLSPEQASLIIEKLKKESFIDEQRYSEAFVNDKIRFNKWGRIKIRQALRLKLVPENIIEESLKNIDKIEYKKILISIINQKQKQIKHKEIDKIKASLIRFAAGRGFEFDRIMEVLEEM
jgi:regulatory protein